MAHNSWRFGSDHVPFCSWVMALGSSRESSQRCIFRGYRPKKTSEAGAFCAMIGELLVSLMTLKGALVTATKPGIFLFRKGKDTKKRT